MFNLTQSENSAIKRMKRLAPAFFVKERKWKKIGRADHSEIFRRFDGEITMKTAFVIFDRMTAFGPDRRL